jgi:transposase
MLKLIDKQKIIIKYFNEGKSGRQIEKELHVSRKTIAKYIKEYQIKKDRLIKSKSEDDLLIADIVEKPKYDSSKRSKVKLTDKVKERINFYLEENQAKIKSGRAKQVKKKIDILEALHADGFDIGYTTVCCAISDISRRKKEAYIRQQYMPGSTTEFDWGEVKLIIANKLKILQMPVFTTAYGNYRSADLYHNQKTESFLDAHANFFEETDGVYKEMVYDNTKVTVARFVGNSQKEPTEALLKLSIYYGFSYRFCNTAKANEKGHVERSVEYVRRKVFSKKDEFENIEEARLYLKQELASLNLRPQTLLKGQNAYQMLDTEKKHLGQKPPRYDCSITADLRVNKYSCISVTGCYYSVPDEFVGQFVTVKAYADKIICYCKKQKVASHTRLYGNHEWKIDINHYLKTLMLKPKALPASTAFSQMSDRLKEIYKKYFRGSEKDFVGLLEMTGKIGIKKVDAAIDELEALKPGAVDLDKISVICSRKNVPAFNHKKDSTIEKASRQLLSLYAAILENGAQGPEVRA